MFERRLMVEQSGQLATEVDMSLGLLFAIVVIVCAILNPMENE